MAPKFALFTKGSKLPLNKGFKNTFELLQSCLNPRFVLLSLNHPLVFRWPGRDMSCDYGISWASPVRHCILTDMKHICVIGKYHPLNIPQVHVVCSRDSTLATQNSLQTLILYLLVSCKLCGL